MKIRFWYPGREYQALKEEIDPVIHRTLSRGDLILRQDVEEFERKFAEYNGAKYCVGVASGTDALMLSLKAFGVGVGDEVITTGYTFRAAVEAIHHTGAIPVIADMGQDWKEYETKNTRAIIPAHLEGKIVNWSVPDMFAMIEDSCQALGARAVVGEAACFSFYPAKILGCYGDGGAIVTNNEELAIKLRKMRNHYKDSWGEGFGFNSRLDNLQAAILNVKMAHLDDFLERRRRIAAMYDKGIKGKSLPIITPQPRKVYQDYVIQLNAVKVPKLHDYLQDRGIETMVNSYPFPEVVRKGAKNWAYEARSLRLPCTPYHTDAEIGEVIEAITTFYTDYDSG